MKLLRQNAKRLVLVVTITVCQSMWQQVKRLPLHLSLKVSINK